MAVLASGAARLREEINALWPKRDKASDGWVADARHVAGGTSDHIPDKRGIVRAIDIDADLDPKQKRASWDLAEQIRLIAKKDKRIKYIIHQGQIASAKSLWRWRRHTGDPHHRHIHISFTLTADTSAKPYNLKKV